MLCFLNVLFWVPGRKTPGSWRRADIFIIVVHPPQKVKEISRLWRNSLFSSKGWDKTGAFMGLLPHGA